MKFDDDDVFAGLEGQEGVTIFDPTKDPEGVVTDPEITPDENSDPIKLNDPPDDRFAFKLDGTALKDIFGEDQEFTSETAADKIRGLHTSLTDLRAKSEKYNEETFNAKLAEITRLTDEVETLMQAVDPLAHFVDENSYKTEQLRKAFPNIPLPVINSVMSDKFDEIKPLDALRLYAQYKYKWTDQTKIDSWIESKYGVDLLEEDFEVSPLMEADSVDFKEQMATIREKEIAAPVNYKDKLESMKTEREAKFNQAKEAWNPLVSKALEKYDSIKVNLEDQDGKPFEYSFNLDKKQLEGLNDKVVEILASSGAELSAESLTNVMQRVQERLLLNNLGKIFRAASGELLYQLDEQWSKETHNPRKLNQQTKPTTSKTKQQLSKEQAEAILLED